MNFRKTFAAVVAASTLLAGWTTAEAAAYKLIAWHQRSSSGALSSLFFKSGTTSGCPAAAPFRQPCYNPANVFVSTNGIATAVDGSPPTFDWNAGTGVMTQTGGILWATSFISSNANGTAVISDRVTGLVIDTTNNTTTATTYECYEGSFLAGVGANGCLNITLGANSTLDTTVAYNVGGNANCVNRVVGGDDASTGNTRGLTTPGGSPGCDAVDGAFDQWEIVPVTNPNLLVLSKATPIAGTDGCFMFGKGGSQASPNASFVCASDIAVAGASYLIFAPAVDTDNDFVVDAVDTCRLVANTANIDSNNDGYGNRCDGDLNNNGATNAQDTTLYRQQLGQPSTSPIFNNADINTNGSVNAQDTTLFRGLLGVAPGPSGACQNLYPCPPGT